MIGENLMSDYLRNRGKRIKKWGASGDLKKLCEESYEHPIMCNWLGSKPKYAHPYNMYGDIKSQPQALKETLESCHADIKQLAKKMFDLGINRYVGTGLGTSQFVAQAAAPAFWQYAEIDASDVDSLEYYYNSRPYDYDRLCFTAYSGSGSTTDTIRAAKKAKENGAYILAITSVSGSPITDLADSTIVCAGGFDTAGGDTFHYTTRLAVSIMIAIEWGRLRTPEKFDYDKLMGNMMSIPERFSSMFDSVEARCESIAKQYKDSRANIIVGSNANLGAAEEMALKFDEMAHIPSKAMCPDRHIHGALGLTDNKIFTIIMAPKTCASYKELKDIADYTNIVKAPCMAIVSEDDDDIAEMVDDVVRIPEEDEIMFTLLSILPSQLIPYYSSVYSEGLSPDTQRSHVPRYARAWAKLFPPGTH